MSSEEDHGGLWRGCKYLDENSELVLERDRGV